MSSATREDVQAHLRQIWRSESDAIEPDTVTATFDSATGEEILALEGRMRLEWTENTGDGGRDLLIEPSRISARPDFDRAPGPHEDAPFRLTFPHYTALAEELILPAHGTGLSLIGNAIDIRTDVAEWHRALSFSGGVVRLSVRERTLAPEVPARAVGNLAATMRKLSEDVAFVHAAPAGNAGGAAAGVDVGGADADENALVSRALQQWSRNDRAGAQTDLDAAVARAPSLARPLALRGMLELEENRPVQAAADIERAARMGPEDDLLLDAQAALAASQLRLRDAIALYSKSLAIRALPQALTARAALYRQIGQIDNALRDFSRAAELDPSDFSARASRWDLLMLQRKGDVALAEADAMAAAHPRDARVQYARAVLLQMMQRKPEARAACQAAIALQPSAVSYLEMARLRDEADFASAIDDLGHAIALDPNVAAARAMRGRLLVKAHRYAEAVDDLNAAVRLAPNDMVLLRQSAYAFELARHPAEAMRIFDRLVAMQPNNAHWLNDRCWLRATSGGDLVAAMDDCNAAVRLDPGYAEALDSRGFVHLRRGEFVAAKIDYDASLHLRPEGATSLYGRALSLRHTGSEAAARQDFLAARKLKSDIDAVFAGYGMKL